MMATYPIDLGSVRPAHGIKGVSKVLVLKALLPWMGSSRVDFGMWKSLFTGALSHWLGMSLTPKNLPLMC